MYINVKILKVLIIIIIVLFKYDQMFYYINFIFKYELKLGIIS